MSRGPEFDWEEHEDEWHSCDHCHRRTQGIIVNCNDGLNTFDCYTCDNTTQWRSGSPDIGPTDGLARARRASAARIARQREALRSMGAY